GGSYRLQPGGDGALFAHAVGHDSLKRFLFPPEVRAWRAQLTAAGEIEIAAAAPEPPRYAFLGVRSCDLHAVALQDRVFLDAPRAEPACAAPGRDGCCAPANGGGAGGAVFGFPWAPAPRPAAAHAPARRGLPAPRGHRFLAEVGSERGAAVLADVPTRPATAED